MKLAYLSTFYPFRGGIAQFNASLYRALEKNNEIKAFTYTRQYPDFLFPGETQFVTEKDNVDRISAERILDTTNPFSFFSAARKIKSYAPDVLLMKYWISYMAPSQGAVAARVGKKTKVISVLDNVIPHELKFYDGMLTNYYLNQNHGFVVMSEAVKKDLLQFLPKAKYLFHQHPLYNHFGEKADVLGSKRKLNIPLDKKVILFFGFIRDYKGLYLLIDAMAKLSNEYVLVIAGEVYGSFDKYQKQIESLGIQDKIVLHVRYISDSEVPLFFSAANVCVLPYKSATQSGITSIAYHFDLPLIATNTGGLAESIHHNKTGIIVSPDSTQIAQAIDHYFSEHLESIFRNEITKLKKQLSWESLADSIVEFSKTLGYK